jgi:hypothetical protein
MFQSNYAVSACVSVPFDQPYNVAENGNLDFAKTSPETYGSSLCDRWVLEIINNLQLSWVLDAAVTPAALAASVNCTAIHGTFEVYAKQLINSNWIPVFVRSFTYDQVCNKYLNIPSLPTLNGSRIRVAVKAGAWVTLPVIVYGFVQAQ